MMVTIGSVHLGPGMPKICVPVVGRTIDAITAQCRDLVHAAYDIVELRIDFLAGAATPDVSLAALTAFRRELPTAPLLFTFRTASEGGEQPTSEEAYFRILRCAIETDLIDAIDVEYFHDQRELSQLISLAHTHGITVIVSNHDFDKTPPLDEIIRRLIGMKHLGADAAKLACMPRSPKDVLTLLSATETVKSQYPHEPLITMSMGKLGAVSRISGEVFGSAMTFGSVKESSAPGQIDANTLQKILEIFHC